MNSPSDEGDVTHRPEVIVRTDGDAHEEVVGEN